MKLEFDLKRTGETGIKITDKTSYLDDSTEEFVFKQFKSDEVYVIDIMEHKYINKKSDFRYRINTSLGISIFEDLNDGWFTIHHTIVPNEKYLEKIKNEGIIWTYSNFFYSDGNKLYHYRNNVTTEVDIIEACLHPDINDSILNRCVDYFSINNLDKIFIEKSADIFNTTYVGNRKQECEVKYERNIYWSAINLIKYAVENQDMERALLTLEQTMNYYERIQNTSRNMRCC